MDESMFPPRRRPPEPSREQLAMPGLFDAVDPLGILDVSAAVAAFVPEPTRIEGVRESNASKHRADIERGKPIAVFVANRDGKVIAETFRNEAARRGVRFDSADETQRGFCWLPVMFAELCKEGKLDLRRHPNGKPDKEYSKAQHNDQNVYLPRVASQESAA